MRRRAVLAMASTGSGGVALLAIAWLAARRLSGAELGFFFSFLSFGALVQLADFGLSYAALQTAGRFAGTDQLHELPALAKRVRVWNLLATTVATAIVFILGFITFSTHAEGVSNAWRNAWIAYLVAVFANQLTLPSISLREGSGRIDQMWTLRLVQEWSAGIACVVALHLGVGLWSLAVFVGARAVVAALWLALRHPLRVERGRPAYSLERWMADVWPFQWKIGLSGLAGFLIFRAFSPIVLLEQGAVPAGRFGLAISLMNLLIAITSAWPLSQAARYAALYASGRFSEIRREFPMMLWSSAAIAALGAAALLAILEFGRAMGVTVTTKLPGTSVMVILFTCAVIHHCINSLAVVLRAEGREPLLAASLIGGVVTVIAVWATAYFGSLRDIAAAYLACTVAGLTVTVLLFRARLRRHVQ